MPDSSYPMIESSPKLPLVSVIVPCYNEESTIRLLLEAIDRQDFPKSSLEVVIADGLSTDRTRLEIAAFQKEHPDITVKVIDNPKRIIPAGLNRAMEEARGEIFVRLDAHSMPYPDYITCSIKGLQEGAGLNVGGVWEIRPGLPTAIARSIAVAAAHPLGVGDAFYRYATKPQAVDTVPFGSFQRTLIQKIGGFDESLLTNEDYEFNARIRQSGGRVWLDPGIRSAYFARPTLASLARQYARYGFWKARMLKRYPHTLRWRQLLPPLFVLSLAGLIVLSIFSPIARWALLAEGIIYALVLFLVSFRLSIKKADFPLLFGIPAAIAVMHISWGAGFLRSMIGLLFQKETQPIIPKMVNG